MKIAVITPCFMESSEILQQCVDSVAAQTVACSHFIVADGRTGSIPQGGSIQNLFLPEPHADCGNVARGRGTRAAIDQGFDAIAYLDADNWFYPDHLAAMIALHQQTNADVCTAMRSVHRVDGTLMFTDTVDNNGIDHVDTSCMFFTKKAFSLLFVWESMPREFGAFGDRVVWNLVRQHHLRSAHNAWPTVAYRTRYCAHYAFIGEQPPVDAKPNCPLSAAARSWLGAFENT